MVYKFRVILDAEEDIFRDIAIMDNATLEDFHNAIVNAFGFDGMEIASFYTCDETWTQEDEISLFDTGDVAGEQKIMSDYALSDLLNEDNTKLIYVYDFLNMWTFLIELAAIEETPEPGERYPHLLFSHGELPIEAPEKDFNDTTVSKDDIYGDFEDDFDEDDMDMFGDNNDSFEDFGFEENWN
ncbi:IS1096 element passenger TnpR family protein [Flavobacterium sp. '19STA2R22 D10 B1']|uniref:IS1096 element passenger TnpR family protein n=1 Tax=Flavobacterium aerium TaxID=3037261 RepID=UPI00278BAF79|nr:hypothetical protein [Flavobacterium sp. '19STA2R22 D10 B1']